MKIYFEMESWEALSSLLQSFTMFVRYKRPIGSYHKEIYLNAISIMRKLLRAKEKGEIQAFKIELNKTEKLEDKWWFMEKVDKILLGS